MEGLCWTRSTAGWRNRDPPPGWSPEKPPVSAPPHPAKRQKTASSYIALAQKQQQLPPPPRAAAVAAVREECTIDLVTVGRGRKRCTGLSRLQRKTRRLSLIVRSSLYGVRWRPAYLPPLVPGSASSVCVTEAAQPVVCEAAQPTQSRHPQQQLLLPIPPAPATAPASAIGAPPQLSKLERRHMRKLLRPARSAAQRDHVIATVRSIPLTRDKLGCLDDGEWLNEEVINAWFDIGVLQQAATSASASVDSSVARVVSDASGLRRPRLHIPLTYFYARLTNDGRGYDYCGVQRWLRKVELFPKHSHGEGDDTNGANTCVDAVLVPLHLGQNHWALMAIDLRAKRFRYFDSLHPSKREAERHANVLWRWLCDEAARRGYCGLQIKQQQHQQRQHQGAGGRNGKSGSSKGQRGAESSKMGGWTVEAVAAAPRQHNGYDCGVFMLMFARSIAVGAVAPTGLQIDAGSWRWSQADMPSIRQRILADLVAYSGGNNSPVQAK